MIFRDITFYFRKQGAITALLNLGMWSLILYRFGNYMYGKRVFRFLILWYLYLLLKNLMLLISKIELPPSAKIGRNFLMVHAYGLVMGDLVQIGNDVTIGPWVVLGHNGDPKKQPQIGDKVYIGAKSSVLGGVVVGDNTIMSTNSTLTVSTPAFSIIKPAFCQIILKKPSLVS